MSEYSLTVTGLLPSADVDTSGTLLGRSTELRRLGELFARAAEGHGQAVVIEGEPGVGKSALLRAAATAATTVGIRTRAGAADEFEQRLPFSTLLSSDDRSVRHARPAGSTAAEREYAIAERLLAWLDRWCSERPGALLLDDIQWADLSSLMVLRRIARLFPQLPLALVIARRPAPCPPELESLTAALRDHGAVTMSLSPLTDAAAAELTTRLTGGRPGPRLLEATRTAAGNPLYLTELLAVLPVENRDGTMELAAEEPWSPPASLAVALGRRVVSVSTPTRDLLKVAALYASGCTVTELSLALEKPITTVVSAVEEAVAAGLLHGDTARVAFRHELLRQAFRAELAAPIRDALHQQIAVALMDAHAPVERIAEHVLASGSWHPRTAEWILESAEALVLAAPSLAVEVLGNALMWSSRGDHRGQLSVHYARCLLWAGQPVAAEGFLRSALADRETGPELESGLRWLLAEACFHQGRLDTARAEAELALTRLPLATHDVLRLHGFVALCLFLLRSGRGKDVITEGPTAYHDYALAGRRMLQGRFEDTIVLAERAITGLNDRRAKLEQPVVLHLLVGFCRMELDQFADADKALEAGRELSERGPGTFTMWYHLTKAQLRFFEGRWDDALSEIEVGSEAVDVLGLAGALRVHRALIAVHRGEITGDLGTMSAFATGFYDAKRRWAQALAAEAAGDPQRAFDILSSAWDPDGDVIEQRTAHHLLPDFVRLADLLGHDARAALSFMDKLRSAHPVPSVLGTAALCGGVLNADVDLLVAAAERYRCAGRPLFQAHAHESAAVVLARQHKQDDARVALKEALRLYGELGASWDAGRAEARLRELGVRRGSSRPRRRSKSGWAALTETELTVANLIAEGRSTQQIASSMFLSRRTVQSHISNILAKLGMTSRVELAVARPPTQPSPTGSQSR